MNKYDDLVWKQFTEMMKMASSDEDKANAIFWLYVNKPSWFKDVFTERRSEVQKQDLKKLFKK